MIEIGDKAPDATLPETAGDTVTPGANGKAYVLFFYPRDNTSGCTKEAIAFSELKSEFGALGIEVYGVSKDSLASHAKFVAKHDLTVPLLSDEDGDLCERYGAWKEKKMYGKTFMGIERTTALVDKTGNIAGLWRKVKVPGHAEAVLEAAKAL